MGLLLQGSYPTVSADQGPPPEPRLFLVSDKVPGGVEEIPDFSQNDLNPDDAFLLDAYYAVSAILPNPSCDTLCNYNYHVLSSVICFFPSFSVGLDTNYGGLLSHNLRWSSPVVLGPQVKF